MGVLVILKFELLSRNQCCSLDLGYSQKTHVVCGKLVSLVLLKESGNFREERLVEISGYDRHIFRGGLQTQSLSFSVFNLSLKLCLRIY